MFGWVIARVPSTRMLASWDVWSRTTLLPRHMELSPMFGPSRRTAHSGESPHVARCTGRIAGFFDTSILAGRAVAEKKQPRASVAPTARLHWQHAIASVIP